MRAVGSKKGCSPWRSGSETIVVFQVRRTCCPRRTTSRPPWWRSEPWWGSTRRSRATSPLTRTELSRSLPSPRSWSKTPWQYKVQSGFILCVCVGVSDGETRTKLQAGEMGGMKNTMMSDWSLLRRDRRGESERQNDGCESTANTVKNKRGNRWVDRVLMRGIRWKDLWSHHFLIPHHSSGCCFPRIA